MLPDTGIEAVLVITLLSTTAAAAAVLEVFLREVQVHQMQYRLL
jgi:hypothetical protein